jgi:hypothetical protein
MGIKVLGYFYLHREVMTPLLDVVTIDGTASLQHSWILRICGRHISTRGTFVFIICQNSVIINNIDFFNKMHLKYRFDSELNMEGIEPYWPIGDRFDNPDPLTGIGLLLLA